MGRDYNVPKRIVFDTLMKISDQLRGPLDSLGGSPTSERGHWAFSEKADHVRPMAP